MNAALEQGHAHDGERGEDVWLVVDHTVTRITEGSGGWTSTKGKSGKK